MKKTPPLLTVITPALNEEKNIIQTCNEIILSVSKYHFEFEILIVDDGSTDQTATIIKEYQNSKKNIRLIQHDKNYGLGAAYKTGIKNALGDFVIMIPGDNAHPANGLNPIFDKIGVADIILPYPKNPSARSIFRQFVSNIFVNIFNFWFGLDVKYYNGLVLHKRNLVIKADLNTTSFAYQAEILVKLINIGATVEEVPVIISERAEGKSRAFKITNFLKIIYCFFYLTLHTKFGYKSIK